jgi:hypothetical protein
MKLFAIALLSLTGIAFPASRTHQASSRHSRSTMAKNSFKHHEPCPSTGKTYGPCPGHVIGHVTPLACGGNDHPNNMQWQTTAQAKAMDKVERKGCR